MDILERLFELWTRVSDVDSVTLRDAEDEIKKLRVRNIVLEARLLRAKELFLQNQPQAAFIEVCAALGHSTPQ